MRRILKYVFALFFVLAGGNHFLNPAWYLKIMPPLLPFPLPLVYLSGLAEILLGLALIPPKLERKAAWGLVALLLAVFPANIYLAMRPEIYPYIRPWLIWLRLPLQFVLIGLVLWSTGGPKAPVRPSSR